MSPRTEKQFAAIRSEKGSHIMETALRLFASNGFESTSVSLIAIEAGISKGLMYNYFESKEDLLRKIILRGLGQFMEYLNIEDENNVQKQELIKFIDGNLLVLKQQSDFYKLYFSLSFQPAVFAILEKDMMIIFEQLFGVITNYYTQKGEKNPYVKTRYLLAVFDGIGMHYVTDTENFPLDGVRDMIVDLL